MKAVIWGCGGTTKDFLKKKILYEKYNIIAFVDNECKKWGECFWNGIYIKSPKELSKMDYDVIIICSLYYKEIKQQLMEELYVSEHRIITYRDLEYQICNRLVAKYEVDQDQEVQKVVNVFRTGNMNVLGSYIPESEQYETVYWDEEGFPYINFENKRMYYPKDYVFVERNGVAVVKDILCEQDKESPHLYIRNKDDIPYNAVVVDAGVCEGNFALRYIERVKKVYLIEAERRWMDALRRTFKDYENKVIFCDRFLSRRNNSKEITLDALVNEKIDFLKMDIEGAEIDALLGGKKVLESSHAKCAICSYHRQYDEKYISYILNNYGYQTSYSKGYMFFPYDDDMRDTLDLRRGIVYGERK